MKPASDPHGPQGARLGSVWDHATNHAPVEVAFARLSLERGYPYSRSGGGPAGDGTIEALEARTRVLGYHRNHSMSALLCELTVGEDQALARVAKTWRSIEIGVAAPNRASLDGAWELIDEAVTPIAPPAEDRVTPRFWAMGGRSPTCRASSVRAASWDEIQDNYPASTRAQLGSLASADGPSSAGRLVLWHGPPGTGKTSAIRSLMRAWSDWAEPHVITDPEQFLATGNSYMLEVLDGGVRDGRGHRGWKLVVLEDAGELMAVEARDRSGQALSRLLNLTDGLLGTTLNAIVIVTTNEPLSKLHPAVHRPGRCWAEIEFDALPVAEANDWLRKNGSEVRVTRPAPLADLYAFARGEEPVALDEHQFGFGRAIDG